jgi:hypothetical protein
LDHLVVGGALTMMYLFSLALFVLVLLVFLQATLHKLFDLTEFKGFVSDYRLLPEFLVAPVAYGLTALEITLVILCLVPAGREIALFLALFLLSIYSVAIAVNLRRGRVQIECGCGGAAQKLGGHLLVRNAVLGIVALVPLLLPPQNLAVAEIIFAVSAGIFLWLIYQFCEHAGANWQTIKHLQQRGGVR